MKKNRFLYSLSAVALACIISFSGLGNTYIQAEATSVGIEKGIWNDDVSAWENIKQYFNVYSSIMGLFINPVQTYISQQSFYDYMISDGISHDNAHGVFCDCDDASHTSFSGNEHGGGGFVRDGVSVDDSGNVTIDDNISDLFHGYITDILAQNYGWYTIRTVPISYYDNPSLHSTKERYDHVLSVLNTVIGDNDVFITTYSMLYQDHFFGYVCNENTYSFVTDTRYSKKVSSSHDNYDYFKNTDYYYQIKMYLYDSNWEKVDVNETMYKIDGTSQEGSSIIASNGSSNLYAYYVNEDNLKPIYDFMPITKDGRTIRVFKNVDSMKSFNVNKQPYYATDKWVNYDYSQDNSLSISDSEFQYFYDNSTTIYQNIQNNIVNGGDSLTESDIKKIVEDTIKSLLDDIPSSDNSDNGNNDNDGGGSGVGDLVGGIGDLLDTILSLIGKVMSVVADFTQSILDLFGGFTEFTDGFSSFLSGAFSFIPQEIWNVIQVGLSLMILLAVIKFLRK